MVSYECSASDFDKSKVTFELQIAAITSVKQLILIYSGINL